MDGWSRIFNTGFTHTIGALERSDDATRYRFATGPAHAATDGSVSRGLMMTVMDSVLWAVVLGATHGRLDPPPGEGATTVTLNSDFTGAALAGETLYGSGTVTRRTRTVVFAAGELWVERDGGRKTVLSAMGVWKILGAT
jgi:acyl-coenzyme A thioesterase PaaI-like protein